MEKRLIIEKGEKNYIYIYLHNISNSKLLLKQKVEATDLFFLVKPLRCSLDLSLLRIMSRVKGGLTKLGVCTIPCVE